LSQLPKDAKHDLIFGRYLDATRTLRLGWSRVPRGDELFALGRLYYRMGFHKIDYYLSDLKKDPVSELSFAFGIGVRSRSFGHRVDISIQIGRRDSLLPAVQTERFYGLSIGVTTAELWFIRPMKKWD
ncbi:MAG: hypothetical protein JSW54_01365, partial [Fidelibacterota bacterium]